MDRQAELLEFRRNRLVDGTFFLARHQPVRATDQHDDCRKDHCSRHTAQKNTNRQQSEPYAAESKLNSTAVHFDKCHQ